MPVLVLDYILTVVALVVVAMAMRGNITILALDILALV